MKVIALLSIVLSLACCEIPYDQAHTLDRVRDGTLKVGFNNAPPWVVVDQSKPQPSGIEIDLVEGFANSLNAKVSWIEDSTDNLFEALKARQLDIVVAGITADSPWKDKIGITLPLITTSLVIASLSNPIKISSLEYKKVWVKEGTQGISFVRKEGGIPLSYDSVQNTNPHESSSSDLIVIEDYLVKSKGWSKVGIVLQESKHVIATAPGENGFLRQLDHFIVKNRKKVKEGLIERSNQ